MHNHTSTHPHTQFTHTHTNPHIYCYICTDCTLKFNGFLNEAVTHSLKSLGRMVNAHLGPRHTGVNFHKQFFVYFYSLAAYLKFNQIKFIE